MAGAAKTEPVMAVMVQDDGVQILDYELTLGSRASPSVSAARSRRTCNGWGRRPTADIKMIGRERTTWSR